MSEEQEGVIPQPCRGKSAPIELVLNWDLGRKSDCFNTWLICFGLMTKQKRWWWESTSPSISPLSNGRYISFLPLSKRESLSIKGVAIQDRRRSEISNQLSRWRELAERNLHRCRGRAAQMTWLVYRFRGAKTGCSIACNLCPLPIWINGSRAKQTRWLGYQILHPQ